MLFFYFSLLGWAFFAREGIGKGHFILEYSGEIVEEKEIAKRQVKYRKSNAGSYVYEFECDTRNRK